MSKLEEIYLDILHIYRSEIVATFPEVARRNFYGVSTFEKIINAGSAFLKALFVFIVSPFGFQRTDKEVLQGKHWLYVLGQNNYHSLKFLNTGDSQFVYVSPYKYQVQGEDIVKAQLPLHFIYMLRHLPTFFSLLWKEKDIRPCWDTAFKGMGMYESHLAFLKKHQPACITFSNDHTLEPRAMILAAKKLGIPTFYIQHACIRPDFPPLHFSHSFLEGQDSWDKYKRSGPISGAVSLVGVPRMDSYILRKNTSTIIRRIGVCSNLLDDIGAIESTLVALSAALPNAEITYRPHPTDKRTIGNLASIKLSDSKVVNPFDFLWQQDLIIAGNTSIHYEAAMLDVHAVYHKFGGQGGTEDMYLFVKNGLVEEAVDTDQLISIIKKKQQQSKEDLSVKAQYYNAVLGTANEGKSQKLVINYYTKNNFRTSTLHRND